MKFIIAILLALTTTIDTAKLVSYLEKCSISDIENFDTCLAEKGNLAIKHIVKGDPQQNLPNLLPFNLEKEIVVKNDDVLKFVMKNVKVYGLENMYINKFHLNPKSLYCILIQENPEISIQGDYEIEGLLLNKPIKGMGRANIMIMDAIYTYWPTLKTHAVDNHIYLRLTDHKLSYESKANNYKFENLYDGDEIKGREMNAFMNENWREVSQIFKGAASEAFAGIITRIYKSLLANVPFDEIFYP